MARGRFRRDGNDADGRRFARTVWMPAIAVIIAAALFILTALLVILALRGALGADTAAGIITATTDACRAA